MKRMADIFRGRIIDVSDNTYTIELTGDGAKLDAFIKSLDQGAHHRDGAHRGKRHRTRQPRPCASSFSRGNAMKVYYDKDADLSLVKGKKVTIIGYGSQGHAHAQNLQESGVKVTVGLRKGGASWDKAKKGGVKVAELAAAIKGADIVMVLLPDEHHAAVYQRVHRAQHQEGRVARLRARLQHPLRPDPAARGPRRVDGRAQGAGPHRALDLRRRRRRADADRGAPQPVEEGARRGAVLRRGDRRRQGRHHRDQLQGRDRDRPLRRADRAVRRLRRAGEGGLRHAGRRGLRARDGVLRVPARAEADRRPDVRGRHRHHELLDLQQRRVRRVHVRARRSSTRARASA